MKLKWKLKWIIEQSSTQTIKHSSIQTFVLFNSLFNSPFYFLFNSRLIRYQLSDWPLLEPYLAGSIGVLFEEDADAAVGHQG